MVLIQLFQGLITLVYVFCRPTHSDFTTSVRCTWTANHFVAASPRVFPWQDYDRDARRTQERNAEDKEGSKR